MSAWVELAIFAGVLYIWESTLLIPARGIALRRKRFGKGRWKVLDPKSIFSIRDRGIVPLVLFPTDSSIVPCQAPPLMVDGNGNFILELGSGALQTLNNLTWNDLGEIDQYFIVSTSLRSKLTSSRWTQTLRDEKARGHSLATALGRIWRSALSPSRAKHETRRWKLVSWPLRFCAPIMAFSFFVGLPLAYVHFGIIPMLCLVAAIWMLMLFTGLHLWWLGERVYPAAKAALRQDALLSLVVPFHAMRAYESASVHAYGTIHPIAAILSTRDIGNPWLGRFMRKILFPMPQSKAEAAYSSSLYPEIETILGRINLTISTFDVAPDRSDDPDAASFCPRCHSLYQQGKTSCGTCKGLRLRLFRPE